MGKSTSHLSGSNLLSQNESVRFDLNMNPLGVPDSVKNVILNSIEDLKRYPDGSYTRLKESIAGYSGADPDDIIVGSCSYEFQTPDRIQQSKACCSSFTGSTQL